MTNQQGAPEALANFDAAVAAVLQCVGTAPCNSHEICTGFAANTRKRLAALVEAHQHARIAELEAQLESIGAGGVSGPLVGHPQAMPDLSQLTERGAKAWAGVDAQALREGRWYMVTHDGVATLCEDRRDAEKEAKDADMAWPHSGPHRAVQLVEAGRASLSANAGEPTEADEWKVRGYLAKTLKCWHRLTGEEAAELVAMTLRLSGLYPTPQPAPPTPQAEGWTAEQALRKVLAAVQRYMPPDGPDAKDTLSEIIAIVDPWPLGHLEK